jgi:hypothetical protein
MSAEAAAAAAAATRVAGTPEKFVSPEMLDALEQQALIAGQDLDRMLIAFQSALRGVCAVLYVLS